MRQFLFILAVLSLLAACTMGYYSHAGAPYQPGLNEVPAPFYNYSPALRYWPEHGP
ncbi:MAG: hypothetical protein M1438_10680 [Deltaproteobacteria bacterium]|nr:hypothetical protein [Deltaproteobacteria bacterium]